MKVTQICSETIESKNLQVVTIKGRAGSFRVGFIEPEGDDTDAGLNLVRNTIMPVAKTQSMQAYTKCTHTLKSRPLSASAYLSRGTH